MPNIGFPELLVVLVIALLVFGPRKLPEVGRQVGRAMREFRNATSEIRSELGIDDALSDVQDIRSSLTVDLEKETSGKTGEPAEAEAPAGEPAEAEDTP